MNNKLQALLLLYCITLVACQSGTETIIFYNICETPTPSEAAAETTRVVYTPDGGIDHAILPNSRKITPYGDYLALGTFAHGAALSPDGRHLAISHNGALDLTLGDINNQSIRIFDLLSGEIVDIIEERELFMGIVYHPVEDMLFAAGGVADVIYVYDTGSLPYLKIAELDCAYPYGLAITGDGSKLLAAESHYSQVAVFDTDTLQRTATIPTLTFPFYLQVSEDNTRAYVTNIGNRSVSVLDLEHNIKLADVEVGKNPEGLALGDGLLYVVNSDDDTISVINTETLEVIDILDLREDPLDPPGITPTDIKLSADGQTLYVVAAGENAVYLLDSASGDLLGAIPTAFYPTEIELTSDGQMLVVNAKGVGTGSVDLDGYDTNQDLAKYYGGLQLFELPDETELHTLTDTVRQNNDYALKFFGTNCRYIDNPIPLRPGDESPIKHVIYLVRENKTYDVLLGTLAGSAGDQWHDPSLAIFGEGVTIAVRPNDYTDEDKFDITPNLHKLSREFVDTVNFYTESDKSTTGHIWLTTGATNDFTEKAWLTFQTRRNGHKQFIGAAIDPVTQPAWGHIFNHLLDRGKSVRVYGEFTATSAEIFGAAFDYVAHDYLAGMTLIDDSVRIKPLLKDIATGRLADFTYIWTPNDHTYGMSSNRPHPAYMLADTDLAAGLIVEAIAQSPYWKDTVIFIIEDDPQSTPDHIDSHRSICVAAGPYVKRGYTSTTHYSFASLHHTMSLILGVVPISRYVAQASPMYDLFTNDPDFTAFEHVPRDEKFAVKTEWMIPEGFSLTRESAALDFSEVDKFNPALGPILWKAMKGLNAEFPRAFDDMEGNEGEE
jgi:YVTN family beta-propeller protein